MSFFGNQRENVPPAPPMPDHDEFVKRHRARVRWMVRLLPLTRLPVSLFYLMILVSAVTFSAYCVYETIWDPEPEGVIGAVLPLLGVLVIINRRIALFKTSKALKGPLRVIATEIKGSLKRGGAAFRAELNWLDAHRFDVTKVLYHPHFPAARYAVAGIFASHPVLLVSMLAPSDQCRLLSPASTLGSSGIFSDTWLMLKNLKTRTYYWTNGGTQMPAFYLKSSSHWLLDPRDNDSSLEALSYYANASASASTSSACLPWTRHLPQPKSSLRLMIFVSRPSIRDRVLAPEHAHLLRQNGFSCEVRRDGIIAEVSASRELYSYQYLRSIIDLLCSCRLMPVPTGTSNAKERAHPADPCTCPRCGGTLSYDPSGTLGLYHCVRCYGVFALTTDLRRLQRMVSERRPDHWPNPYRQQAASLDASPTLICPICRAGMLRIQTTSATCVDVCRAHGTWLDRGDCHRICTIPSAQSSLHPILQSCAES